MFTFQICFISYLFLYSKCAVDDTHKRLYCSLGLSRDEDCPVDGGWSPWGIWGPCQGECGQVGRRMRQRTCTNPMPVNGGSPCTGEDTESEACELKGCTLEEYEGLVMGDPLRAAQLRILRETRDKFPALSERCIVTTCRFQTVESVLKETAMDYWNALHCVKHNVGCPVRGGWTNWTPWSPCSAKCGLGSRYQERSCTKPVPSTPQLKCEGPRFQTHTCEGLSCAPKLDGKWSEWKPWSECSVKCGPGIKTRKRDCLITEKKREVEPESMEGVSLAALEGENIDEVKSLSKREGQTLLSGTACSGPSEEVEECMKEDCSVDGGWSAWEVWQPCSAECGIGAQSRSRSCSNPAPQGGGVLCTGTITEVRHCFKRPCTVKTHQVAVFPGDGSLLYSSLGRPARLILIFIRFLPLATSGNLIVRYQDDCSGTSCDFTKLVLEGQFLVLSAQLSGCRATVVSVNKLELSKWHVALATVTGTTVTLRVDDAPGREFAGFNCVPILPEMDHPMRIGERYRGQIQRLAVNFNPVRLHRVKGSAAYRAGSAPYASSNVIYEVADAEEGYRQLKGKELVRAACPAHPEHWKVEIALRPKTMDGLLMFLPGEISKEYMLATLESGHVRVRVRWGNVWAEADSIDEVVPGHWLLVTVHRTDKEVSLSTNGGEPVIVTALSEETPAVCKGEMLVGDMPNNVKKQIEETEAMKSQGNGSSAALQSLQGDLGSLEVDDSQLDLSLLPAEIEPLRQFSSHSSSVSEAYEEVALPVGQQLNLTCFLGPLASGTHVPGHGKIEPQVLWLRLDEPIIVSSHNTTDSKNSKLEEEASLVFSTTNTKHHSHLTTKSYRSRADVEGFYSCWVQSPDPKKAGRILISFGVTVVDFDVEFSSIPVKGMMAVAATSVLSCIIAIFFIIIQMRRDRHDRFGLYQEMRRFFRGQSLSKEEQLQYMLRSIWGPQGRIILGSEDALSKSQQQARKIMSDGLSDPQYQAKPERFPTILEETSSVESKFQDRQASGQEQTYRPEYKSLTEPESLPTTDEKKGFFKSLHKFYKPKSRSSVETDARKVSGSEQDYGHSSDKSHGRASRVDRHSDSMRNDYNQPFDLPADVYRNESLRSKEAERQQDLMQDNEESSAQAFRYRPDGDRYDTGYDDRHIVTEERHSMQRSRNTHGSEDTRPYHPLPEQDRTEEQHSMQRSRNTHGPEDTRTYHPLPEQDRTEEQHSMQRSRNSHGSEDIRTYRPSPEQGKPITTRKSYHEYEQEKEYDQKISEDNVQNDITLLDEHSRQSSPRLRRRVNTEEIFQKSQDMGYDQEPSRIRAHRINSRAYSPTVHISEHGSYQSSPRQTRTISRKGMEYNRSQDNAQNDYTDARNHISPQKPIASIRSNQDGQAFDSNYNRASYPLQQIPQSQRGSLQPAFQKYETMDYERRSQRQRSRNVYPEQLAEGDDLVSYTSHNDRPESFEERIHNHQSHDHQIESLNDDVYDQPGYRSRDRNSYHHQRRFGSKLHDRDTHKNSPSPHRPNQNDAMLSRRHTHSKHHSNGPRGLKTPPSMAKLSEHHLNLEMTARDVQGHDYDRQN